MVLTSWDFSRAVSKLRDVQGIWCQYCALTAWFIPEVEGGRFIYRQLPTPGHLAAILKSRVWRELQQVILCLVSETRPRTIWLRSNPLFYVPDVNIDRLIRFVYIALVKYRYGITLYYYQYLMHFIPCKNIKL